MTQEFLLDAIVEDLERLFKGKPLKNSAGEEREIRVYPQDLPIRAGADIEPEPELEEPQEDAEPELEEYPREDAEPVGAELADAPEGVPKDVPEPYIVVRIQGGELPEQDTPQKVEAILGICVHDPDPDRQGFRDALYIVNTIMRRYAADGLVGRRYVVQYPIKWATSEEDNHPYYFAAMALTFEAPAMFKEVPET